MKRNMIILYLMICLLLSACGQKESLNPSQASSPALSPSAGTPPASTASEPLPQGGELALEGLPEAVSVSDNARVFYEIFVGSFSDSNGDGIGDLRGIINRMDYLNDGDPSSGKSLGVEGLWLTPIFKSNSYHKYNVNDYYALDPDFGTLEDLKELIALCHSRDVKLILDLPINHTGSLNPWFNAFVIARRQNNASDPYYHFYTFCPQNETPPASRTFQALAGTDIAYECNFSSEMPELNFDQEAVREAVLDVAKYYLDLGVDGFRFDAAKYIYLGETAKNASFWQWYVKELKKIKPDIYTIAEVWDGDSITSAYYPAVDCFNFTMAQAEGLIDSTAKAGYVSQYTAYLDKYLKAIRLQREDAMLHAFISNHDMDRASGYLTLISGQMQMAANLYLLTPGSPFIYYGEEIGIKGSRGGAVTDANRRLAMRWGDGDSIKDPPGSSYEEKNQVNGTVQDQWDSPTSLYSHYKKLIALRKANPAIARGSFRPISLGERKAGGFISEWEEHVSCVIHNTSRATERIPLSEISAEYLFSRISGFAGQGEAVMEGDTLILSGLTSVVLTP